jgi:hypothetical protein
MHANNKYLIPDDLGCCMQSDHLLVVKRTSWIAREKGGWGAINRYADPDCQKGLLALGGTFPEMLRIYDPDFNNQVRFSRFAASAPFFLRSANKSNSQAQAYFGCMFGSGWGG